VKAWELLGETRAPDGTDLRLTRHASELVILANGRSLMSSRMHGSEEALASLGCRHARSLERPCVLVGGLGMGFTLRATLDVLPADATVVVAELVPAVVEWNRGALGPLAGHPLNDRRVHVAVEDVRSTLRSNRDRFAAVLLDVDNGPVAMTATTNAGLYDNEGVAVARAALTDDGVLAVWSAADHRKFEQRLRHAGFDVTVEHVRARLKGGGPRHSIILGRKRPAAASGRADRAEREESHER
jgi:spermidine synthase